MHVSETHRDALAAMGRKVDQVRYVCEMLGHPETTEVRQWLESAGVEVTAKYVSRVVNEWRDERNLSDTGTFRALTADVLAEVETSATEDDTSHVAQPVAQSEDDTSHTSHSGTEDNPSATVAHRTPVAHPEDDPSHSASHIAHPSHSGTTPAPSATEDDTSHVAQPVAHVVAQPEDDTSHVAQRTEDNTATAPVAVPVVAQPESVKARGAWGFYVVAVVSLLVSVDTSWRYFRDVIGITNTLERAAMFSVVELALIACGFGMAASVRRGGRPGPSQVFAWALCGFAGFMAWQLSGPGVGVARVVLGPVVGMVALHLALGIERQARAPRTGVLGRVLAELQERLLTLLHIADDDRDAAQRTRDQAAARVAKLAHGRVVLFKEARLRRAVRISGAAHDPIARERMLAELDAERHIGQLATLERPSPWQ